MNPDQLILQEIHDGIPLIPRPFEAIGSKLGIPEDEVIERLRSLVERGIIRRFGVVVRHRMLGFTANAMVTWNVPDERVREAGERMRRLPFVTLCYRRRRAPPAWNHNLYAMIHGKSRNEVLAQAEEATREARLEGLERRVLFSGRCFKQKGASYLGAALRDLDQRILNRLQAGIGLEDRPYAAVARELGIGETVLLARLKSMLEERKLSRFGPMFNVERFGGRFTLVALEVPKDRFEETAAIVSSYPEVAHNYEREHRLNMWFVTATGSQEETDRVLAEIRERTGLEPLALPKLDEYFLQLRLRA